MKAVCCVTGTWNSAVHFLVQNALAEEEKPELSAVLLSSSLLQWLYTFLSVNSTLHM